MISDAPWIIIFYPSPLTFTKRSGKFAEEAAILDNGDNYFYFIYFLKA